MFLKEGEMTAQITFILEQKQNNDIYPKIKWVITITDNDKLFSFLDTLVWSQWPSKALPESHSQWLFSWSLPIRSYWVIFFWALVHCSQANRAELGENNHKKAIFITLYWSLTTGERAVIFTQKDHNNCTSRILYDRLCCSADSSEQPLIFSAPENSPTVAVVQVMRGSRSLETCPQVP